ncbi:outer membrane beta-barrel protein [Abyssalbus ytuae]|uniref:Porin family protein n=1 Tax=Abyssalbus ytuae TaxID=2926907 RepID=A0A9E7CTG6_9FLAO|nr:outer membrane beta-barrel protein [Abyssalbus ytuae]UOB16137.1 porin family protein [Abyssalbus ytuae]
MRKLLFVAGVMMVSLTSMNAQEEGKFRVGLDLGFASTSGGGGVLISLEPKYNLSDNMNVGIRLGSAAFARTLEGDGGSIDLDVATNASYLGTFDYYFSKGNSIIAPYLGAGLGIYSLASSKVTISDSIGEESLDIEGKSEFGGMIRGGVELGKFRIGIEYNLIPKTDFDNGLEAKNSYLGFSLGFYVGGGKWKK